MTSDEIISQIRRGIREPNPETISNADITSVIGRGVTTLGLLIKEVAPSYFMKQAVLSSTTHVYALPSDCLSVQNVWDTGTTAGDVEAASNASPINIEITDHGFSDNARVLVYGVGGNTAANGTFQITYVDADNFTLDGSVGTAEWTSGGKVLELTKNMTLVERKNPERANRGSRYEWMPRGSNIVIDYIDQAYDLLIDYIYRPSAVSDIPEDYHDGLVAYGVINSIQMPPSNDRRYGDMERAYQFHMSMFNLVKQNILESFQPSNELVEFNESIHWDLLY